MSQPPPMYPPTVQDALRLAVDHFKSGRLAQSETICQQVLGRQPDNPLALQLLASIALQGGKRQVAAELIRRAIALYPQIPEFHITLGTVLQDDPGQFEQAAQAFRRAIELRPELAEAHNNLGLVLLRQKNVRPAIDELRQAIQLKPNLARARMNLGDALREIKDLPASVAEYKLAIQFDPTLGAAHQKLSALLQELGQQHNALEHARQAVRLSPREFATHNTLGNALQGVEKYDEAIEAYRAAIALKPDSPEGHNNLACALEKRQELDEAIDEYQTAIRLAPSRPESYVNLGNALKDAAELDEAITSWRKAIELDPNDRRAHDALIYTLHFHPEYDSNAIAQEQARWVRHHAEPLEKFIQPHLNNRDPGRRLRIGYVSPDFYGHAESYFTVPLIEAHDRTQFEVHCYASVRRPDSMTERIKKAADVWHDVLPLTDQAVAEKIRADQVDILIDVTMHMLDNRLPVFARKAAPVQVTWLAYPGSTGLKTIDYRLTDSHMDPANADESWSAEEPYRLPDCWVCWEPVGGMPEVSSAVPGEGGAITFGSLNNFCKINRAVMDLWAKVLHAVPNSRLLLLCSNGRHRQKFLDAMQLRGIPPQRIALHTRLPRGEYLKLYNQIDIGLDTFPYNGITTTCDAMWMGVPVLALVGTRPTARAGLGILNTVGLQELIADSETKYVQIATELAADLPRLTQHRATLRRRMQTSPLMDAARFAHHVESAYRKMWLRYAKRLG